MLSTTGKSKAGPARKSVELATTAESADARFGASTNPATAAAKPKVKRRMAFTPSFGAAAAPLSHCSWLETHDGICRSAAPEGSFPACALAGWPVFREWAEPLAVSGSTSRLGQPRFADDLNNFCHRRHPHARRLTCPH